MYLNINIFVFRIITLIKFYKIAEDCPKSTGLKDKSQKLTIMKIAIFNNIGFSSILFTNGLKMI